MNEWYFGIELEIEMAVFDKVIESGRFYAHIRPIWVRIELLVYEDFSIK